MKKSALTRRDALIWELPRSGAMRVPALIHASGELVEAMDDMVASQLQNVASLPGIVGAALAMPDAHSGYGFPIGGVAAFDPDQGGVVSAGGVGFDIACGVRTLLTNLSEEDLAPRAAALADLLFYRVPSGLGGGGDLRLTVGELDRLLLGGAAWAVGQGFGEKTDLSRIEEGGTMAGARPEAVSDKAKKRQLDEVGTLGSGNHYLEVQVVEQIYDPDTAEIYGLFPGQVAVSIHCGSRGLGHQIGEDYLKRMLARAHEHGIKLPDKELACAPIRSDLGQEYLGAMRAGVNCALANRQVITHLARECFAELFPGSRLPLLYDLSHNTCKVERHVVNGREKTLFVHRKGATRAFGPGSPDPPDWLGPAGQPILIGGSMGAASYILSGNDRAVDLTFGSTCHGAGRAMSRSAAHKRFKGREVLENLADRDIEIRARSFRGLSEEAPGAYKDIEAVVDVVKRLGLADTTARLRPLICVKG